MSLANGVARASSDAIPLGGHAGWPEKSIKTRFRRGRRSYPEEVNDVGPASDWFCDMGLRLIAKRDSFAVLELRGGTHLILGHTNDSVAPGTTAPIDLMVDDLDAMRGDCVGPRPRGERDHVGLGAPLVLRPRTKRI